MGILKKINTACRIVKEEGMYVMFYKFKAKFGIGSAGENAGIASDDEKNYKMKQIYISLMKVKFHISR
jgi:hypothetical protein